MHITIRQHRFVKVFYFFSKCGSLLFILPEITGFVGCNTNEHLRIMNLLPDRDYQIVILNFKLQKVANKYYNGLASVFTSPCLQPRVLILDLS